jgi:hypothetical protein
MALAVGREHQPPVCAEDARTAFPRAQLLLRGGIPNTDQVVQN